MRHFLGFRALREIQKSMRERGSKCATFAQNHNIWTHWMGTASFVTLSLLSVTGLV